MIGFCLQCGHRLSWLRRWDSLYCGRECTRRQQATLHQLADTTPEGKELLEREQRNLRLHIRAIIAGEAA